MTMTKGSSARADRGGAVSKKPQGAPVAKTSKLPKMFRGALVVRGKGMKSEEVDTLVDRKALDEFDARREMWVVLEDRALQDPDDSVPVKGFRSRADAVRYARSRGNGNIDQRVLRVSEQVLVIATRNDL